MSCIFIEFDKEKAAALLREFQLKMQYDHESATLTVNIANPELRNLIISAFCAFIPSRDRKFPVTNLRDIELGRFGDGTIIDFTKPIPEMSVILDQPMAYRVGKDDLPNDSPLTSMVRKYKWRQNELGRLINRAMQSDVPEGTCISHLESGCFYVEKAEQLARKLQEAGLNQISGIAKLPETEVSAA